MRNLLLFLCACFLATAAVSPSAAASAKPNVVLFLIDDLGWNDIERTGSTFYETPRLNQLAAEGAFFPAAYAASPVCSPTRASVLTGKYPSRFGLTNHSGSSGPKGPDYPLNPPAVSGNMPLEDVTLAEALKEAGYQTAHVGKWHLQAHNDTSEDYFPREYGFDLNIAGHRMGQPGSYDYPYESEQHPGTNVPDMEDGEPGDYLTDALTDKAIDFIEANQDQPFFLNMWYYTVHTPIIPRKDKLEAYRQKAERLGLDTDRPEPVPVWDSQSRARQDDPRYAAMVESMDENIGRILDALARLDLENETIVIFTSDNGGLSTGASGNAPTSLLPLRAGKAWVYEGGIRVPLLVRLPGKVKASRTIEEPVITTDIYPTILELAGLPLRPDQHLDGRSLAGLLSGDEESLEREALYFHYPHYHHINSMGPAGAVRMGDYKLIEVYETGAVELYNLKADIGEQNDLAPSMPELTAKLTKKLHDWRENSGAVMPTPNPDYSEENDWRNKKMDGVKPEVRKASGGVVLGAKQSPVIENKPIEIHCSVVPGQASDGVLVAQGGKENGYVVYVENGNACFSVRIKSRLTTIKSVVRVPEIPFRIEAILAEGGAMSLRVDGVEVASGNAGSLLTAQPGMGFSIGQDAFSPVGSYELPFTYSGEVSEVFINGEERSVPAAKPTAFYTPKQDLDGLKENTAIKAGLPNVMIIGDSISIGYTPPVIDLLKDVANVQRVSTNCGDTNSGLQNLKRWLGDTSWDVIHFNWGLHDLCYRHPESKVQGNRDKIKGTVAVPLDQYEQNLETLVVQLKQSGARLIWASTTSVPEGEAGRVVGDDLKYNAVAEKIMKKHSIAINDLYALSKSFAGQYSSPGDVHFNKEGSAKLAEQVAESIKVELGKRVVAQ